MILYIISLFPPLYRLNSKEVINPKFHILNKTLSPIKDEVCKTMLIIELQT